MEKLKKEWPHLAVLGASFLVLPALSGLAGGGTALVVLLLVVFPLESLLCGFFAGKAGGFAWWFFLGAGVLFTSSIPMYYNTPSMYSYGLSLIHISRPGRAGREPGGGRSDGCRDR